MEAFPQFHSTDAYQFECVRPGPLCRTAHAEAVFGFSLFSQMHFPMFWQISRFFSSHLTVSFASLPPPGGLQPGKCGLQVSRRVGFLQPEDLLAPAGRLQASWRVPQGEVRQRRRHAHRTQGLQLTPSCTAALGKQCFV